uniref:DUF5672 domain-containing protein n=1 Tax=viral metagenome TaxID=1070528 RepID=A0A6C0DRA9_9ZZZZ
MKNTALIVEPRVLEKTVDILNHFVDKLGDNWEYIFYCGINTKQHWEKTGLYKIYELRELDVDNFSSPNFYSDFLKSREIWESLSGEFVLTFQLDTWILGGNEYNIDYFIKLNKSYIGGNMNYNWVELLRDNIYFNHRNFNGGLSLRKRLDMLKIIETFPPKKTEEGLSSCIIETHPEDVYFTTGCYFLGFPLGDDETCSRFAIHSIFKDSFFGIHQPHDKIKDSLNQLFPELKYKNPHLHL